MRVAVIGSGLSGLLCAATLRRARGSALEVTRFDRAAEGGGRARSPEVAGVPMNLGPRAIYRGAPLHRALHGFGIAPTGFSPPTRGVLALLGTPEDGALVPLPGSLTDLIGASILDAKAKRAFALALARISLGALDVDAGMSVATWLDVHGGPPRSRALLATLLRVSTYAHDESQDATLALQQLRRALTKGVLYVDGCWQAVVDPLGALAGPLEQRAFTSPTDLDAIDADHVVLALPAKETRALVRGLPAAPPPITASCLDIALHALPLPRRRVCFGLDAPLYFSVHTPEHASARDPAGARVSARVNAQASAPASARAHAHLRLHVMGNGHATREQLERFVDLVQPGWRDHLVDPVHAVRYLSRMIVASSLPRAGVARTPLAAPTSDGARRIWLAGDHVDCGELLADASAESALRAARAVLACERASPADRAQSERARTAA